MRLVVHDNFTTSAEDRKPFSSSSFESFTSQTSRGRICSSFRLVLNQAGAQGTQNPTTSDTVELISGNQVQPQPQLKSPRHYTINDGSSGIHPTLNNRAHEELDSDSPIKRVFLDKAGSARLKPLNDPVPLDACPSLDVAPIASIPPSPRPDRASSIPSQEPACLSLSLDMNPLGLALQEEGLSALLKFFPASSFSLETAPFARTKTSLFFRAGRWRKDRDDDCATFESLSVQVFPDVDVQSPARLRAFFQSIKPAVIAAAQSDHLQKALGIATLPEGLGLVTRWYPESASTATMPRSKIILVLRDVALGLRELHRSGGKPHARLGLSDILIDPEDGHAVIRSNLETATEALSQDAVLFQSPEALAAAGHVDTPTDIFSFGAIAVALLSGKKSPYPFEAGEGLVAKLREALLLQASPPDVPLSLPADLRKILLRCLAMRPEKRCAIGEVIQVLSALAQLPDPPAPPNSAEATVRRLEAELAAMKRDIESVRASPLHTPAPASPAPSTHSVPSMQLLPGGLLPHAAPPSVQTVSASDAASFALLARRIEALEAAAAAAPPSVPPTPAPIPEDVRTLIAALQAKVEALSLQRAATPPTPSSSGFRDAPKASMDALEGRIDKRVAEAVGAAMLALPPLPPAVDAHALEASVTTAVKGALGAMIDARVAEAVAAALLALPPPPPPPVDVAQELEAQISAARLELEGMVDARVDTAIAAALPSSARADDLEAVRTELRAFQESTLATIEEMSDAVGIVGDRLARQERGAAGLAEQITLIAESVGSDFAKVDARIEEAQKLVEAKAAMDDAALEVRLREHSKEVAAGALAGAGDALAADFERICRDLRAEFNLVSELFAHKFDDLASSVQRGTQRFEEASRVGRDARTAMELRIAASQATLKRVGERLNALEGRTASSPGSASVPDSDSIFSSRSAAFRGEHGPATPSPPPAPEGDDVRPELEALTERVQELAASLARMQEDPTPGPSQRSLVSKALQPIGNALSALAEKVDSISSTVAASAHRPPPDTHPDATPESSTAAALRQSIASETAGALVEMRGELVRLVDARAPVGALSDVRVQLQGLQDAVAEFGTTQASVVDGLRAALDQHQAARAHLERQVQVLSSDVEAALQLRSEIEAIQKQVRTLQRSEALYDDEAADRYLDPPQPGPGPGNGTPGPLPPLAEEPSTRQLMMGGEAPMRPMYAAADSAREQGSDPLSLSMSLNMSADAIPGIDPAPAASYPTPDLLPTPALSEAKVSHSSRPPPLVVSPAAAALRSSSSSNGFASARRSQPSCSRTGETGSGAPAPPPASGSLLAGIVNASSRYNQTASAQLAGGAYRVYSATTEGETDARTVYTPPATVRRSPSASGVSFGNARRDARGNIQTQSILVEAKGLAGIGFGGPSDDDDMLYGAKLPSGDACPPYVLVANLPAQSASILDARSGQRLSRPLQGHQKAVRGAALVAQGEGALTRCATASDDGTAKLWDWASGECLYTTPVHPSPVSALALSAADPDVVCTAAGKTVRVIQWDSGTVLAQLDHAASVLLVHFEPFKNASRLLVTAAADKIVRVFDWKKGSVVAKYSGLKAPPTCVAFSEAHAGLLAIASSEVSPVLFDCGANRVRAVLSGHTESTPSVSWHRRFPHILATGSFDGHVFLWDISPSMSPSTTGAQPPVIVGKIDIGEPVLSLSFSPLDDWSLTTWTSRVAKTGMVGVVRSFGLEPLPGITSDEAASGRFSLQLAMGGPIAKEDDERPADIGSDQLEDEAQVLAMAQESPQFTLRSSFSRGAGAGRK